MTLEVYPDFNRLRLVINHITQEVVWLTTINVVISMIHCVKYLNPRYEGMPLVSTASVYLIV